MNKDFLLFPPLFTETCQKEFHNDHPYAEDKLFNKCLLSCQKESMISA